MDEVAGVYFSVVQIKHDKSKKFVFMGSENMNNKKLIMELYTLKLHSGRDLKKGDNKKVAMGYNYLLPKKIYEIPLRMRDKIKINDEEMQTNLARWQSLIGYVPQSIAMIDAKIRENIAFGLEGNAIDDEKIWSVL